RLERTARGRTARPGPAARSRPPPTAYDCFHTPVMARRPGGAEAPRSVADGDRDEAETAPRAEAIDAAHERHDGLEDLDLDGGERLPPEGLAVQPPARHGDPVEIEQGVDAEPRLGERPLEPGGGVAQAVLERLVEAAEEPR